MRVARPEGAAEDRALQNWVSRQGAASAGRRCSGLRSAKIAARFKPKIRYNFFGLSRRQTAIKLAVPF